MKQNNLTLGEIEITILLIQNKFVFIILMLLLVQEWH